MLQNLSQPVWLADAETEQYVDVSNAALEMFGYTREEFLALRGVDILDKSEHGRVDAARENAKKKWGLGQWWHFLRKDGTTFHAQVRFHFQQFEGRRCLVVMIVNTESAAAASAR